MKNYAILSQTYAQCYQLQYRLIIILLLYLCLNNPLTAFAQGQQDSCTVAGYTLSLAVNHATCYGENNGSATVSSTGCDCFYSGCEFQWSSGEIYHTATKLTAGTYGVTISHPNGCVLDTSVTITEPPRFVEDVTYANVSCQGQGDGTAEIIPNAMAGPLEYNWSNGASAAKVNNLPVGMYEVTVTNFIGCQIVETVEIGASEDAQVIVQTLESCEGGATGIATVEVDGGAPPYQYKWNNGGQTAVLRDLTAGEYFVTITDNNGCQFISQRAIIEEVNYNVTASAANNVICIGDAITLNAQGGESYLWSPTNSLSNSNTPNPLASPNVTTTYEVLVKSSEGCINTAQVTVQVLPKPEPYIMSWTETICQGSSTQLIATEPNGANFSWSPTTGLNNPTINAPTASPSQTTTYTVTATNAAGCTTSEQITVKVETCTGIFDQNNNEEPQLFHVVPNPNQGRFNVAFYLAEAKDVQINVFNTAGMLLFKDTKNNYSGNFAQEINLTTQSSGLYYVEVLVGGRQYVDKVMIK